MSKITELFDVLSRFTKEKGERINSIKLKKELYDDLNSSLPEKKQNKIFNIFLIGIRVESIDIDNSFFPKGFELISVINDRYFLSRIDKGEKSEWKVVDMGPDLWDGKFSEYGSPFDDKYWNP